MLAYAESRDGLNLTGRFLAVSGSSFDVSGADLEPAGATANPGRSRVGGEESRRGSAVRPLPLLQIRQNHLDHPT